jgi:acetyl-CoA acetyltransferase
MKKLIKKRKNAAENPYNGKFAEKLTVPDDDLHPDTPYQIDESFFNRHTQFPFEQHLKKFNHLN